MSTVANPKAEREAMRGVRETRISPRSEFELREIPNGSGGTNLRFTGFACVTGAEYEMEDHIGPWIESVSVGAFKKTLSEGADVAFLLNHEGMTLARTKPGTLKLAEQTDPTTSPILGITGLHSEALLDPQNFYVQAMRSAVDRGDLDEMSMAFRVVRQRWSYEEQNGVGDRRWLQELNLDKGDTSLVNYAASPATGGTVALRQRLFGRGDTMERERAMPRDARPGDVFVPDYTHVAHAQLALARSRGTARHAPAPRRSADVVALPDYVERAKIALARAKAGF
jgi:hypothetical protein